jgi:hypothetical protein
MIVNTPDGQVNFPDSMAPEDIQNVLRQKYGFTGAAAPSAPSAAAPAPIGAPPSQGAPTPSPTATSAPIGSQAPGGAGQGPASSLDPNWKPSGNALWDFITRPRATTEGVGQAASDYGRAIADTATFGQADRLAAYMNQTDLKSERALTEQAHQRLGLMDYAANAVGYAPLGELGIASKLGGGIRGALAEGAGAGALGAYGHDQSPVSGALMGGGGGFAGGVAAKAINPIVGGLATKIGRLTGALDSPADITQSLQDAKTAAYGQLKNTFYNPNDVTTALQNAGNEISLNDPGGGLQRNAPRSVAELTKMYNQAATSSTQTAHDIYTSIQNLDKPQGALGGSENEVAPIIQKHLQNVLDNVQPVSTTKAGAAADLAAAKTANQQWANARDLQQWSESLKGFGQSPAGAAQKVAETYYTDPSSDQYKALSNIANAAGGANAGQSAYSLVHGLVHPAIEGLAFHALPPGIAPAAAAAATFLGAKPAIGAALGARSTGATQNAINAAYPTLTGQRTVYQPDFSRALQTLLFGRAASNFQ